MTTTTPTLPIGIAIRPESMLACAHCGIPTDGPRTEYHVLSREIGDGRGGVLRVEDLRPGATQAFGLCAECEAVGEHAARLLTASPSTARRIGSPARHQITCALDALRVIDAPLPEHVTDEALAELLALAPLGATTRWSAMYAPVRRTGTREEHAASEPWLFVGIEARAEIRGAYTRWLARRRPPRPVPSPSGGCLLCGVGSVLARHGDIPWRETTANGTVLGGARGTVNGHLCPPCQGAQDESGSHMLDAAIMAVIDPDRSIRRKRPYPPSINGAQGWAVTGEEPNREPFAHLDLDGLRHLFATGEW